MWESKKQGAFETKMLQGCKISHSIKS